MEYSIINEKKNNKKTTTVSNELNVKLSFYTVLNIIMQSDLLITQSLALV